MARKSALIECKKISKSFDRQILKDINFKINSSGIFIISGDVGSGKSVFLDILSLNKSPDKGTIIINGKQCDIYCQTFKQRFIGYSYQHPRFIESMSALENIKIRSYINPSDRDEYNIKALQDHFKIELDRPTSTLSGGEKQIVSIIRASFVMPSILILDEPFNNLDSSTCEDLISYLEDIKKDTSIIISSHIDKNIKSDLRYHLDEMSLHIC